MGAFGYVVSVGIAIGLGFELHRVLRKQSPRVNAVAAVVVFSIFVAAVLILLWT